MWVNNLLKVITRWKSVTAGIWTCEIQIQKPTRWPLSHHAQTELKLLTGLKRLNQVKTF